MTIRKALLITSSSSLTGQGIEEQKLEQLLDGGSQSQRRSGMGLLNTDQ
ncbi:hypothetical protein ACFPYJ_16205 [Paenibacillus solisilvae]|uniref:Uncharacterized protein n=1 Tax=Paenibacillus solisilvae TaxID=2486751 RepID=A0ABW0W0J5_9BACL